MRVQMADVDGAVLSGVNLNEAISLYTQWLLYHGILPTPGRLLSLHDDLVAQWLYCTMAMGIPL